MRFCHGMLSMIGMYLFPLFLCVVSLSDYSKTRNVVYLDIHVASVSSYY